MKSSQTETKINKTKTKANEAKKKNRYIGPKTLITRDISIPIPVPIPAPDPGRNFYIFFDGFAAKFFFTFLTEFRQDKKKNVLSLQAYSSFFLYRRIEAKTSACDRTMQQPVGLMLS